MANKKEQSVDSILAAAGAKMNVKTPPTGAPIDNGQQFDFSEAPITGPIDFGKMKLVEKKPEIDYSTGKIIAPTNEDAKYGKAFQIAQKTAAIFKVESVKDFINLVEKVKESL